MTYTLITTKTFCSNDSNPYRLHRTCEKINMSPKGVLSLIFQENRDKGAWSNTIEIIYYSQKVSLH